MALRVVVRLVDINTTPLRKTCPPRSPRMAESISSLTYFDVFAQTIFLFHMFSFVNFVWSRNISLVLFFKKMVNIVVFKRKNVRQCIWSRRIENASNSIILYVWHDHTLRQVFFFFSRVKMSNTLQGIALNKVWRRVSLF